MVGLSRSALYALIAAGELRTVKAGTARLIPVAELRRWPERRRRAAGAGAP
jgi:excisionase family DNA binding protein